MENSIRETTINLIIEFYSAIDDLLYDTNEFLQLYDMSKVSGSYNLDYLKNLMKNAIRRGTNNE